MSIHRHNIRRLQDSEPRLTGASRADPIAVMLETIARWMKPRSEAVQRAHVLCSQQIPASTHGPGVAATSHSTTPGEPWQ